MSQLTAGEIMTRGVLTAEADWSIDELRTFLVQHSITGAPVVNARGKLLGVVSTTDLMRAATEGTASEDTQNLYAFSLDRPLAREELQNLDVHTASAIKVFEIMTPLVFEVAPNNSIRTVAEMMTRGRIHRVFVTSGGRLEGVISALDLVRVLRDMLDD